MEYRAIKNVSIRSILSPAPTVSLDLVYFNPNRFGMDVRRLDCDVFVGGNLAGHLIMDTLLRIPANAESTLPASMSIDVRNVLSQSVNAFFNNEITLTIKGTTRVGKGGIFFTIPVNYTGKHKLNLFR